jgi:hypothetical protein
VYVPRIYGFKVSERARNGPKMTWLRERPERWEELDTVDWQGKFISDKANDDDNEEDEEGQEEGVKKEGKGKGKLFDDEDDEDDDEEEEEEEEEIKPISKPAVVLASPAEVLEKGSGSGKGKGARATTTSPAITPVGGKVKIEKVKGERTR